MSRALFLSLSAENVALKCEAQNVGVSVIEELPGGGVRLVCNSIDGADRMRLQLKKNLLADDTVRRGWRTRTPLW